MQNNDAISCLKRLCNTYINEILNSFNPELQLNDTLSVIINLDFVFQSQLFHFLNL